MKNCSFLHSVSSTDETPQSSSKIHPCQHIFTSLLGVSSGDETLHLMLDILHQKIFRSIICYISFIFHHPVFKLKLVQLTPDNLNLSGKLKKV